MESRIQFGIDLFLQQGKKYHQRFALVTNDSAKTSNGEFSRKALLKAGFKIVKLFSPEHGLNAHGIDGGFQKDIIDTVTGLPVISLYSKKLMPNKDDLSDIDTVLFDIPDVGCRFYTYLWTMTYILEACAICNKKCILLDRPNPIGGNIELSEGPMLDEKKNSTFISRWNIPVRHSCTFGELAKYFSITRIKDIDMEVIKVGGWKRDETGNWNFAPPSPAIRDRETAFLYPGMGLLEGINVNEGRGTETPFKVFGAPWILSAEFQKEFLSLSLPGITSHPITFQPYSGLYTNEICHGLQFHVTNINTFRPVNTGLHLISLLLSSYPLHCTNRLYKTTVNPTGENHLDKLTGVWNSLRKLREGKILRTKLSDTVWRSKISNYLIY